MRGGRGLEALRSDTTTEGKADTWCGQSTRGADSTSHPGQLLRECCEAAPSCHGGRGLQVPPLEAPGSGLWGQTSEGVT